jgi:hypothetical protein
MPYVHLKHGHRDVGIEGMDALAVSLKQAISFLGR